MNGQESRSKEDGGQEEGGESRIDRHRRGYALRPARCSWQFNESHDVGKSLTAERRKKAKTKVKSGPGDNGDG
jgi:hypothetical protein